MELEAKKCLYDVQKAAREIEAFAAGLAFESLGEHRFHEEEQSCDWVAPFSQK